MFLKSTNPKRSRLYVSALFIIVVLLSLISLGRLKWSEDVSDLLPRSPQLADYMELVKVFRPDNRIFFLVKKTGDGISEQELIQAADALADRLETAKIGDRKLFTRVIYRQDIDPMEAIDFYLSHQGVYFDETIRDTASGRLTADWLTERFSGVKQELLKSSAPGLMKLVSRDPLNLSERSFKNLQDILPVGDEKIRLHRERLFGENLCSILVITEPESEGTDISRARHLVTQVEQILGDLLESKANIEVVWMAGHRFAVANAGIIRSDVTRVFIVSGILIVSLIWLALRSFAGVFLLVLPPLFGLAFSFFAVSVIKGTISAIALGMATILAGITIDYGIHIFCHGRALGNAEEAAVRLRQPLIMAAATTTIAFAALHVSSMKVLRELGTIAAFCIISAALFALYCFPLLLSWFGLTGKPTARPGGLDIDIGWPVRKLLNLPGNKRLVLLGLLTLLLIPGFIRLEVEGDLQKYNAIDEDCRRDFAEIGELIGIERKTVFLALRGTALEDVLARNYDLGKRLYEMQDQGLFSTVSSISHLLLPLSQQEENLIRWQNFWSEIRRERLTAALKQAAAAVGMSFPVFAPYLRELESLPPLPAIAAGLPGSLLELVNGHMTIHEGNHYILTRVEPAPGCDVQEVIDKLRAAIPGIVAADMGMLRHGAMALFIDALLKFGGIVFVLIAAFLLLLLRDLRHVFELLLPLVLAVLWTFGALGWLGIKMDASSSIISVVIFGLVIDYSIFISDSSIRRKKYNEGFGVVAAAITLSGASTILGFGSLILAKHPVLYTCGITAIAGTICGWLAVTLSSSLYPRQDRRRHITGN